MSRKCKAFCPGGITSFFEICDLDPNGQPLYDQERIGARGGGFVIDKGVSTEVSVEKAKDMQIRVFINNKIRSDADTTLTVVKVILEKIDNTYHVTVKHDVEVPIGSGFGSSGAGALGTALALCKALNLNLSYNQIGQIAHVAEVRCKTGLGTVSGEMLGGVILTIEPGAPGYGYIDRIPFPSELRIITATYKPILTKDVLNSLEKKKLINQWGKRILDNIVADPSLENFMLESKKFALNAGFMTNRVRKLIELAETNGAVGATQNMIGEAVHALVIEDSVDDVVQAFEKIVSREKITTAKIDLKGARLL